MDGSEAKRLKQLEDENAKLKKLLAEITDYAITGLRDYRDTPVNSHFAASGDRRASPAIRALRRRFFQRLTD